MKIPRPPHSWNVSTTRAVAIQKELASRIVARKLTRHPRFVAGADLAFSSDGQQCIAGVVVWDTVAKEVIEQRTARRKLTFPYIPGLLSFREAPAVLAAMRKLRSEPDVFMFDGQGLAHPRRFGLACHVGLLLDRPTLGCAKSRLCGQHADPGPKQGNTARLLDGDECIGQVLRTKESVKPVYVSIGHRITLSDAIHVVLSCCTQYRLPEPTRLADRLVADVKRNEDATRTGR